MVKVDALLKDARPLEFDFVEGARGVVRDPPLRGTLQHIPGADALRGNTRSHPEHDG